MKYAEKQGNNQVSILEKIRKRIEERLEEWTKEERDPFLLLLAHGVLSSAESCEIIRLRCKERALELIERFIEDLTGCFSNNDIEQVRTCIFNLIHELIQRFGREL